MQRKGKILVWSMLIATGLLSGLAAAVAAGAIPLPFGSPPPGARQKDMTIGRVERKEVVANLLKRLDEEYVFPDKAKEMTKFILTRQREGRYDAITSAEKLATALTEDLHEVSKDRHLGVLYSEKVLAEQKEEQTSGDVIPPEQMGEMVRLNFGLERVERLPFNIGYLELRAFAPGPQAAGKIAAAMTLLSDTHALIIDLRGNGGGSPEAVALLAGYFFDRRTHLNDIFSRKENRIDENWSAENVAGTRYGARRKVYILTSSETFSAAEDFSYAMKNLRRATIVGETTGGGAHPGDLRRLHAHFQVFIPNARSISPVTKTDWEGTGVMPDIKVSADKALDEAQIRILEERLATEKDEFLKDRIKKRMSKLG